MTNRQKMLTIQPYERQPQEQSYQYPPLQVDGKTVTYGSFTKNRCPLSAWISDRSVDARFMCNDFKPMDSVNDKSFLNKGVKKTTKNDNNKLTIYKRQERAISKMLTKFNNSLIYRQKLHSIRITIQRDKNNQFVYLDNNNQHISKLFDKELCSIAS